MWLFLPVMPLIALKLKGAVGKTLLGIDIQPREMTLRFPEYKSRLISGHAQLSDPEIKTLKKKYVMLPIRGSFFKLMDAFY